MTWKPTCHVDVTRGGRENLPTQVLASTCLTRLPGRFSRIASILFFSDIPTISPGFNGLTVFSTVFWEWLNRLLVHPARKRDSNNHAVYANFRSFGTIGAAIAQRSIPVC